MTFEAKPEPLNMQHVWNMTHVGVTFSRMVPNVLWTPEEARAFINGVEKSLEERATYLQGQRNG